jgi:hypothetical protein
MVSNVRSMYIDIATTLNHSSHVTPDTQRAAAATLDAAFHEVGQADETAKGPPCRATRSDTAS